MARVKEATLDDLIKEPGKAELVNGEIVRMPPTGFLPGFAAMQIFFSACTATPKRTKMDMQSETMLVSWWTYPNARVSAHMLLTMSALRQG